MIGAWTGEKFKVNLVTKWPSAEIVSLYKEGGWWKDGYDPNGIPAMISGSTFFAVAVPLDGGGAIGMGRVISDGSSDAYIQDVVVRRDLRGAGIGREIVRTLLEACKGRDLEWIGLIAEEGTQHFYEDLGFSPFPGRPMLYKGGV